MKTQNDIARQLQISPAAVSLALRGGSNISPELRERVLALVRKHRIPVRARARDVQPNSKSLRLGYCSAPHEDGWLHVSAYRGMSDCDRREKYDVLMFLSVLPHGESPHAAAKEIADQVSAADVNGLIVDARADLLAGLSSLKLPRVLIGFFNPAPETEDAIVPDNFWAGYRLTQALLAQGHRRIACLRCNAADWNSIEKFRGHCAALEAAGIEYDSALTLQGDFSWMSAARCAESLARWRVPPTAVFIENDWLTAQFVQGLRGAGKLGLRLLETLKLAHIVDARRETGLDGEIDRIELRTVEMGRLAANLLLDRISGKMTGSALTLKVAPEFFPAGPRRRSAREG